MATKKISELPAAGGLTGTELLVVVQGGVTKQVPLSAVEAFLTPVAPGVPPTITTQPSAASVVAGGNATFTVVAAGDAPLAYQWRKDGVAIGGATAAGYTTPGLVLGDNGAVYTVVVSNDAGSVTSAGAALTVTSGVVAPTILTTPAIIGTPTVGVPTAYTPGTYGGTAGTITRTWTLDGATLVGETGATYTPIQADIGKALRVVETVTNTAGDSGPNTSAPKTAAYIAHVADRTLIPQVRSATAKSARCRARHANATACTKLRARFPAWYVRGAFASGTDYTEQGAGGPVTWTASVEYPIGSSNRVQFLFSGATSGVAADGGYVEGEATVSIPADTPYYIHCHQAHTTGFVVHSGSGATGSGTTTPSATFNAALGDAMDTSTTTLADITMDPAGVYDQSAATNAMGPYLILAEYTGASVLNIGTSLDWGHGDQQGSDGAGGLVARSMADLGIPYVNAGVSGDSIYKFLVSKTRRMEMAAFFSHIVSGGPGNDLEAGRSAATIFADLQTFYALFPGKTILQCTSLPLATSGGTTPKASQAARVALRGLLLNSKPSALLAVVDQGPVLEKGVDTGVWLYSSDSIDGGVHGSPAGYQRVEDAGLFDDLIYLGAAPTLPLPGQVGTVTASNVTTTSFDVTWPGVRTATRYDVAYKLSTDGTWTAMPTVAGPATFRQISGLPGANPGATYHVRVTAVNRTGAGAVSATASVTLTSTSSDGVAAPTLTGSPTLGLHYDFGKNSTITQSGGSIDSIVSAAGTAGAIALANTDTARPTITTRNGIQVARFTAANSQFLRATGLSLTNGGSLVLVCNMISVGTTQALVEKALASATTTTHREQILIASSTIRARKCGPSSLEDAGGATATTGLHLFVATITGSGAYFVLDGGAVNAGAQVTPNGTAPDTFAIGCRTSATGTTDIFADMEVFAALWYPGIGLSEAQGEQLAVWANSNYGTPNA